MSNFFDTLTKGISSDSKQVIDTTTDDYKTAANDKQLSYDSMAAKVSEMRTKYSADKASKQFADELAFGEKIKPNTTLATPGANPYGVSRMPWVFTTFSNVVGVNKDGTTTSGSVGNLDTAAGSATGIGVTDYAKSKAGQGADSADSIIWYANPKSVEWSINQRGSETKTKGGTVLHMWRDKLRKTDYDDPKITMTFQTGNIMPLPANAMDPSGGIIKPGQQPTNAVMPPGLNDFYKFLELVDRAKIAANGAANLVHILYRSRIFPSMVISGFFEPQSVVRFSDNADNPYQVNSWSATFTIYKTVPAINSWAKLAQQFKAEYGLS